MEDYSEDYLKQILTDVKTIAVVGASPRAERDSYRVMQALLAHGYTVIPVNPYEAGNDILGQRCYANLASIQQHVDMVDIFRTPEAALGVTREAIAIGASVVWMQLGVINEQAAELAAAAGLRVVMNRCPKIELARPYWTGRTNNTLDTGALMENPGSDILRSEQFDTGVLRLTLNDQKRRNALSATMLGQLADAFSAAESDAAVRVIVLAAEGPAFCAGHDLKEITAARSADDHGRAFMKQLFDSCASVMELIVNHPRPVIAEVAGVATAAGCQLVASCDLALAADSARFATPGVNIGLFCSTPMVALSRNVSNKHAMEMLLTGEMISAQRAAQIGLINRAVAADALTTETMAMAGKIASKSSMTLAVGKRAFYKQAEMPLSEAYKYASQVMVDNMLKHDAAEGIGAFLDKRAPEWTDQ